VFPAINLLPSVVNMLNEPISSFSERLRKANFCTDLFSRLTESNIDFELLSGILKINARLLFLLTLICKVVEFGFEISSGILLVLVKPLFKYSYIFKYGEVEESTTKINDPSYEIPAVVELLKHEILSHFGKKLIVSA